MDKDPLDYEEFKVSPLFRAFWDGMRVAAGGVRDALIGIVNGLSRFTYRVIRYWKGWLGFAALGAIAVLTYFSLAPGMYTSELILVPRFDIQEQMINDIDYLKSLVKQGKYAELGTMLSLSEEEASTIKRIDMTTLFLETDKIRYFDVFASTIDSTLLEAIDLEDLMTDPSLEMSYSKYHINIESTDPDIFAKMEAPILELFRRNSYSIRQQSQWERNLRNRMATLMMEIEELDSLKTTIQLAMEEDAKSPGQGTSNIVMGGEVSAGNPYITGLQSVFDRTDNYYAELSKIEMMLAAESDVVQVQAHFAPSGIRMTPSIIKATVMGALEGIALYLLLLLGRWFYQRGAAL